MLRVQDLMSSRVISLQATDTMYTARSLMRENRVRHLPVVDEQGRLQGLITQRDILATGISHLAEIDEATRNDIDSGIPVTEVMRREMLTLRPDESVRAAAQLMVEKKIGCLPVVEGDRLVGIVTESDFLKLVISLVDELARSRQ